MDDVASCHTALLDRVVQIPETIPIASLNIEDSPRRAGLDLGHVRLLASSDTTLPPIVVQRGTLRVVDGVHRVKAAQHHGHETILARFFDGTDEDAFILGVALNASHGLPLSLADRTAAAGRILGTHPTWSDRRIARATGLSATTVGALRKRSTVQSGHLDRRTGSDGRARPLSSDSGRREAGRLLAEQPELSLREVARLAGVAPSTVRDVRERLRAGEEVVPQQRRPEQAVKSAPKSGPAKEGPPLGADAPWKFDREATLESLRNDPSIRFNESGRALLRLLNHSSVEQAALERIVHHVPPHWAGTVAELLRANAHAYAGIAAALERRGGVQDAS
ncbi:ParB N-terminal domain-containing protein [Streptomyces sp. NPDC094143]|uniref:ParB N-terminal domain-containing protein n=1 Tax=Streptomyces sp. NPDC094143 TaxID=3155310 RepID=UPI00331BD964